MFDGRAIRPKLVAIGTVAASGVVHANYWAGSIRMSKRSTKSSADDTAFLAQYRSIATRIVRLVREVAAEKVLNALIRRPYVVPRILSDIPGAAALTEALAALAKQRASSTLDSRAVDSRVRAILREAFSDPDTKSTLRVFEGELLHPPRQRRRSRSIQSGAAGSASCRWMTSIDIPGPWLKRTPGATTGRDVWARSIESASQEGIEQDAAEHETNSRRRSSRKRPSGKKSAEPEGDGGGADRPATSKPAAATPPLPAHLLSAAEQPLSAGSSRPREPVFGTKRPPLPRTVADPAPTRWVSAEIEDHPPTSRSIPLRRTRLPSASTPRNEPLPPRPHGLPTSCSFPRASTRSR